MLRCCAVSCHKNFSAQSASVLFCASVNKTLELEHELELTGRLHKFSFTSANVARHSIWRSVPSVCPSSYLLCELKTEGPTRLKSPPP